MNNLLDVKGIQVATFLTYQTDDINEFLRDHNGDIIDILAIGSGMTSATVIIVYRESEEEK